MSAILIFILFVATQFLAAAGAMLYANRVGLFAAGTAGTLPVQQPVVMGIAMLLAETLLAAGLLAYFRWEKSVRQTGTGTGLLKFVKLHPLKRELPSRRLRWYEGAFCIVALLLLSFCVSDTLNYFHLTADDGSLQLFRGMMGSPWCLLLVCLIGPLCEELVFRRGILCTLYRSRVPAWIAVAVSALAFAVVHGNLVQGVPAFVIGIVLGCFYLRTGDLRLCFPAHVVNNVVAVLTIEDATTPPDHIWGAWLNGCMAVVVLWQMLNEPYNNQKKSEE